ncbi:uncharacterized protein BJ212DRAFT_1289685 [Suillus subaureus]|uniref:Uncharacterized protein n=1 Tax=Suillus subaureus TaxID=48587 RepID=A0A9P7DL89_9AGAM|nr:uncharacterized protein BJ212DRAFT_1289685 [Suillus subaureus]KAG1797545.1 hypothetical protein BJ212DRAFT_1289685 [Suillus subaureus]
MYECEFKSYLIFINATSLCSPFLVYWVNWLKAKAQYDRWSEELKLVQHEMYWTVC